MYGKEINITLEDALLSLESLRFMLGGAIKKATDKEPIYVQHTEEVVVTDADGKVPMPKDHLTGVEMTVTASTAHPVRAINLTKGVRTQLTKGTIDGTTPIVFKNPKMIGENASITSAKGDHIRLFWVEEVTSAKADNAVEVVISPDTLENPGEVSIIKITNCWEPLRV